MYGDLRPSNIVFSRRGLAKLVDFELVTRLDRHGRAVAGGGDARYVAPEQWQNADQQAGRSAEIHALGAILFHALTGRLSFEGICSEDRIRQASILPVPVLTELRPSLPTGVDAICRKWLHPQPDRRYAKACDLADDLRRVFRAIPIEQASA
jgi:serine/threonine-protein kinase